VRPSVRSLAALTATVAALGASAAIGLIAAQPVAAQPTPARPNSSVAVSVLSVTPSTPPQSHKPATLSIVISLTNLTADALPTLHVVVTRGDPIALQAALDSAIANPQPPDLSLLATVATADGKPSLAAPLEADQTATVTFTTTTDIPTDAGICLCHNQIYPLYITADVTGSDGNDDLVGVGQTYVPAFATPDFNKVTVSWVWPIIDRPHRLTGDSDFIDDDLAGSVADGGRLDRVLQVAEHEASSVSLTLVIDPELIDELAVMGAGPYTVTHGSSHVTGSGTAASAAWLQRLRAVIVKPNVQVSLTAPADPDVESLTDAGLGWTAQLGSAAERRVTTALGGQAPAFNVAWPVDGAADSATVQALVSRGANSVVLNDQALPAPATGPAPNGLTRIATPVGDVAAFVTSTSVQRYVGPVLNVGGTGLGALPELVAQVALHATDQEAGSPYLVITAPRYVDPSPSIAERAIADTAHTFWSTSATLSSAQLAVHATDRGQLAAVAPSAGLPEATVAAAREVTTLLPEFASMMSAADASTVLGDLPDAVQRAESAGWQMPGAAALGADFAGEVTARVRAIESGVQIVKPHSDTYTLASSTSPLPVAIRNDLGVPVTVLVRVTTANGAPGFRADDSQPRTIPPGATATLQIPTHVDRTGRFQVEAVLLTPNRSTLGTPVFLSVRSTALGTVGVIITVVAGGVLALALLLRLWRRLRHRAAGPTPPVTAWVGE
jgi:hypothetical protein